MSQVAQAHLPGVRQLVKSYAGRAQTAVVTSAESWRSALEGIPGDPAALMTDPLYTRERSKGGPGKGDRVLTRAGVAQACADMDLDDSLAVLRAFVLVVVWGSGTSNNRSFRYLPAALGDRRAPFVLADTARMLQRAVRLEGTELTTAYRSFVVRGVGPSFFTKWFAFAGRANERDWHPLILDARVIRTMNQTLGVLLRDLADSRGPAARYESYVRALHEWSNELPVSERVSPERLEWIMYENNGRALPSGSTSPR